MAPPPMTGERSLESLELHRTCSKGTRKEGETLVTVSREQSAGFSLVLSFADDNLGNQESEVCGTKVEA